MKYYWHIIGGILIVLGFAATYSKDSYNMKPLILGFLITGLLCLIIGLILRKFDGTKW